MLLLPDDDQHQPLSISGLKLFFTLLLTCLTISNKARGLKLFTNHHGRSHRLAGLFHLLWLLFGAVFVVNNNNHLHSNNHHQKYWHIQCLTYDIILGISGIITTLTAAASFPHRHIINQPGESGTLSKNAIVTQDEMVEHSFYQGVNLCQAVYLHVSTWGIRIDGGGGDDDNKSTTLFLFAKRFLLLFLVTLPWTIRKRFPVNSFSANWKRNSNAHHNITNNHHHYRHEKIKTNGDERFGSIQVGTEKGSKSLWLINGMYRFKKWQYIFYKHVILHGLNISVALSVSSTQQQHQQQQSYTDDNIPLPLTSQWRIFWLLLNTSYVMEFFLQSLVKRRILTQRYMMILNALLMISASIASMEYNVLGQVRIEAALISLFLSFYNRGHDVLNTMITFTFVQFVNNFVRV